MSGHLVTQRLTLITIRATISKHLLISGLDLRATSGKVTTTEIIIRGTVAEGISHLGRKTAGGNTIGLPLTKTLLLSRCV